MAASLGKGFASYNLNRFNSLHCRIVNMVYCTMCIYFSLFMIKVSQNGHMAASLDQGFALITWL